MAVHEFTLVVDGLDLDDVDQLDALFEATGGDAVPVERDGVVMLVFHSTARDAMDALTTAVVRVEAALPAAKVVRLDEDLVATSDIAARVGRSRQSIRQLVEGTRGPGAFPAPAGWVGDGIRVWRWADVVAWFADALDEDHTDGGAPVDTRTSARVNQMLLDRGADSAEALGVHLRQRSGGISLLHRAPAPTGFRFAPSSSRYEIRQAS